VLTIGLTGGIGSGKSTVAQWFKKQGVPVLDADKTAHRLLESDPSTISELVSQFGAEIVGDSGEINRTKLGLRVFSDKEARKQLECIVHPRVMKCMLVEQAVLKEAGVKLCLWDVPLLFEAGFENYVDEVWVVWVPRDVQLLRVLKRDKLSLAEVEARIAAQGSLDRKRQLADVVIDNSGSKLETERQLDEIWANMEIDK